MSAKPDPSTTLVTRPDSVFLRVMHAYLIDFMEDTETPDIDDAVDAIWCNARDDKPYEYFNPPLNILTVKQVGLLLELSATRIRNSK